MNLWAWVADFPVQSVATPATAATGQGEIGELSQVSQLSQGVEGQRLRSAGGQVSQLSQLSQSSGDSETCVGDDAREVFEQPAAIASKRQVDVEPREAMRWPFEEWGDLRPCLLCRKLTPAGRCLAAWRGELRAAPDYAPTFRAQLRRCIGYAPKADDPVSTPGRERWPELVETQARSVDGKPAVPVEARSRSKEVA